MIELKNLNKIYRLKNGVTIEALNDVNIKLPKKGMIFIVGKSGSGKSTLLNIIGGLDSPTSGKIIVNNKNITNFKKEDFDSYRNTYVGFVFQEFNILNQFNVYENIELSLKLQNKKVNKNEVDELLKKLGIEKLGLRKTNELSGGEKQRVAIARALIKNPQLILADEPTGNLDEKSSKQIFDILKEISKEKLVVVVSHDVASANKYASRIIEIKDGIVTDTDQVSEEKVEDFELKKSKLPFLYSFKISLNNLKYKPTKLFMTILLTAISLIFMGFAVNCALFDKTLFLTKTMQNNENYIYDVYKSEFKYLEYLNNLKLDDKDKKEIEKVTKSKLNIAYSLYNNGNDLSFEFGSSDDNDNYYKKITISNFIEVIDERILGKVIGRAPNKNNEIVIHKYLADYIIKYGIVTDNNIYYPKDYNELISSKQKIKLGDNIVYIVGIINDDDTLYKEAESNGSFKTTELQNYVVDTYVNKATNVYVKGFTNNVILKFDKYQTLTKTWIASGIESKIYLNENMKALEKKIDIVTKNGLKSITKLEKDEVIISVDGIRKFDKNFDIKFNRFLETQSTNSYQEHLKTYLKQYLNEKKFILSLTQYNLDNRDNNVLERPVKIIGISLDNNNYVSYQYVSEFNPELKRIEFVRIYDDNMNTLTKTFKTFTYRNFFNNKKVKAGTYYNYDIDIDSLNYLNEIIAFYEVASPYILIVSLIFILFTFLLFSNFIALSISYCKKEIGILRAIGTKSVDVVKIFGYESIIIAILSWGISIIGWIISCNLLNHSLYKNHYFIIEGIIMHPLVPIVMFVYTIMVAILITSVSIGRTTKIKPIDAINNK